MSNGATTTKRNTAKNNRIWIELEWHSDPAVAKARAEAATRVLRKLGDDVSAFWFNIREGAYCITTDTAGSYQHCKDHGHWFNLDYLAK